MLNPKDHRDSIKVAKMTFQLVNPNKLETVMSALKAWEALWVSTKREMVYIESMCKHYEDLTQGGCDEE